MIGAACLAMMLSQAGSDCLRGQTPTSVALTGQVTSTEEGAMEGALISAKKPGSTITVTVVSDERGRYSFPSNRLEPGHYALTIRAVGYDLDGLATVEIRSHKTSTVDLKLVRSKDLASQLTNTEWLMSIPGTDRQKTTANCSGCHTMLRIVKSTHNADEFVQTIARMGSYAPGSTPLLPQQRIGERDGEPNPERFRRQADYLSTINLSAVSQWGYSLKTLPRPAGRATHAVITEYDLPRHVSQPHDVVLDSEGMVWYSDFGSQYLGKLDPRTGKVIEYPVPELKPGFPRGALDLELDKQENPWLGMMLQAGIAKFDRKTEKFQIFALPPALNTDVAQVAMVMPAHSDVDGKVWMNNVGIRGLHRLELSSGHFDSFALNRGIVTDAPGVGEGMEGGGGHSAYGIAADSRNNLYFLDFGGEDIGRIDAETGKVTLYATPTPHSRPRRGHMDSQDRLWFAEYGANKVGMFDTRTERFQEWAAPTPWTNPYDVVEDKNGELWIGGMNSDRIVRMDPKTNQSVEYLLPRPTNVRRVFVDNSTTPVTFWVGSNHGASIVKLEPLD